MWKDFFYYSKSERRAVIALSLLIVLFMIGSVLLPNYMNESAEEQEGVMKAMELLVDSTRKVDEITISTSDAKGERELSLRKFDPNSVDSIELIRLGLSSFVVNNVMKYRAKGGVFKTPEDFSRIYGLLKEEFELLRPFIDVAVKAKEPKLFGRKGNTSVKKDSFPKVYKYSEGTLVDVATADTTELKKIPGIGSGIARRIVDYRSRLGGFYRLNQLMEVEFVTEEMMKWFTLGSVSVQKIFVNRVDLDRLQVHPYINFYQAKIIVEYRKKHGKLKSLSQLSLYEEFTEKDLNRLYPYVSFD